MSSGPLKVVCGIIFLGDKLLVTRRDPARAFPLHWEFPGGKIEDKEPAETALHRELKEELSLKVTILRSLRSVAYNKEGHHLELIPFLCRPDQQHGVIPHDHVEVRWIQLGEAGRLQWAPADIPLVEKLPKIHQLLDL